MSHDLVYQLLDHASPERLLREVRETLDREKEARIKFREWLKPDVKAEFINGEIIMHSPAKRRHNEATIRISTFLRVYSTQHSLGEVSVEKALIGLERSDVEPDVCFWRKSTSKSFSGDMDVYPAPDLVVEVLSKSTQHRDRGIKKEAYETDGVEEYWIVDTVRLVIEQYVLGKDKHGRMVYHLNQECGVEETLSSVVLPGFQLPIRACFDDEAESALLRRLMND